MEPSVVLEFQNFKLFSDETVERSPAEPPPVAACQDFIDGIATLDVTLDESLGVWARLFLPENATTQSKKLPILLYFHGGGFCFGSTAAPPYHCFLSALAKAADVLIASVDYRLAPEHRLPAAYEDGFNALNWVYSQALLQARGGEGAEPWLAKHADFSKCFLGGDSAGANIAHNVAMLAVDRAWDSLFRIQGMILIHPYFGSAAWAASELEDPVHIQWATALWRTSLPAGAHRDHPACNPFSSEAPSLVNALLPPALILVAGKDALRDRGLQYFEALTTAGKAVKLFNSDTEGHVFHLLNPQSENVPVMLKQLIDFIRA